MTAHLLPWARLLLDLVFDLCEKALNDGSFFVFVDPRLDLFQPNAEQQTRFRAWRGFKFKTDYVYSPDGTTKHPLSVPHLARDKLLQPTNG